MKVLFFAPALLLFMGLWLVPFFLFKAFLMFFIVGAIFKFMLRHRWRRHFWGHQVPAFADRIRSMSDEEYDAFRNKFSRGCGARKVEIQDNDKPSYNEKDLV
ncbi:hypothetical protein [Haliscomenobacter hydrossis]|uniref:Uncharacterized protein n=1 Tax=Haliscomenobacter hydrossis (strain ATCC 27775 / DSM 1100 / LMG 10767 / O) TaxID=760192 RepID=F4L0J5_HALH1|nr:hypothetical protein [Haliscomenobacter hydrossis]AEE48507.1 hypothetical protein Halhy_0598 [Haliscomenobacter hydrossis DSM 1100]